MSEWMQHRYNMLDRKLDAMAKSFDANVRDAQEMLACISHLEDTPEESQSIHGPVAEQAAAAAEPAAEPSPAVAEFIDYNRVAWACELWELARAAREQERPGTGGPAWDDSHFKHQRDHIVAHRALYQRGDAHGYRRCLVEAKATSELNSELARDLTLLQQENAQLKSRVEELVGETHVIGKLAADRTKSVTQLEQENAQLKSEVKDLAHSLSQPDVVVIGDLEGELKRCDAEPTPAPEPASPEPTPATRKIIQIAVDASSETYSGSVFALCSDGSLWSRQDLTGKSWERQPDIPQGPTQ
jgi:hypothetical protein